MTMTMQQDPLRPFQVSQGSFPHGSLAVISLISLDVLHGSFFPLESVVIGF
jgi:hypothetical protein